MSRRKVQKVIPISAIAPSRQVEISQTRSILPDPDGRWAARRQVAISDASRKSMRIKGAHGGGAKVSSHDGPKDLDSSEMSAGKSVRIGRNERDENTLFGKHVVFV
ncbi:hypothetical protein N1937_29015 (plasmid) [Rhizobium sp. WSM4643]|uniref:hypothetical protein n=1 Tax=Rhizobium sp. WSM4643 TaxID=3138253 RepID=UPI0021A493D1|nr:hypothetical protein [Rhizobium leguminosarum]UWM78829.1 hypothetical protein N1937_29015 [Rhizobium leguminosarum bv. viciae]